MVKGWYTYDVHQNCPIFKTPHPPCPSTSKFFLPPWPWTSNFRWNTTLQMITNQLKENIIQEWLLYVIRPFLQIGFRFQYQPINLVSLSFDFFHLAEASLLYLLLCGFIFLRVQLSENIKKCLFFIVIPIFSTHFAINLPFCATWKSKQTTEQLRYRAYKRTKSNKSKTKSRNTQIDQTYH